MINGFQINRFIRQKGYPHPTYIPFKLEGVLQLNIDHIQGYIQGYKYTPPPPRGKNIKI